MAHEGFVAEWDSSTLAMWIDRKPKPHVEYSVGIPNAHGICIIHAVGNYKFPPIIGARLTDLHEDKWTWQAIAQALTSVLGRGGPGSSGPIWVAANSNVQLMSTKYRECYGRSMP